MNALSETAPSFFAIDLVLIQVVWFTASFQKHLSVRTTQLRPLEISFRVPSKFTYVHHKQ